MEKKKNKNSEYSLFLGTIPLISIDPTKGWGSRVRHQPTLRMLCFKCFFSFFLFNLNKAISLLLPFVWYFTAHYII